MGTKGFGGNVSECTKSIKSTSDFTMNVWYIDDYAINLIYIIYSIYIYRSAFSQGTIHIEHGQNLDCVSAQHPSGPQYTVFAVQSNFSDDMVSDEALIRHVYNVSSERVSKWETTKTGTLFSLQRNRCSQCSAGIWGIRWTDSGVKNTCMVVKELSAKVDALT